MKNEAYEKIVQDNLPKENKLLNAVIAFVVGGLIGMFGNFHSYDWRKWRKP